MANVMKVSRMAIHKHLVLLQNRGLVEAIETRGDVGRPRMHISINKSQVKLFFQNLTVQSQHMRLISLKEIWEKMASKRVPHERQNVAFR